MTDFIVAIDLGTSHITGIVGEKNEDGTFSIIACETGNPASCIQRGNISNVENTAVCVSNLIRKLEARLKGRFIDRVYIGVGGQSLRTVDHIVSKNIKAGEFVSEEDIFFLNEQCEKFKPDMVDVLYIVPPVYYKNGDERLSEVHPVGVSCEYLEARYKIVVGRPSIRMNINKSIKDRCIKEVAGIIIAPLALADAMLSNEEKDLGCALVDFGAGVTSIVIYKKGELIHFSVIPLGGNLITRDIMSMQLTDRVAENLKINKGNAIPDKEDIDKVEIVSMEGGDRDIAVNDLNAVIEGRSKEIIENVYTRISEVIELKSLGSGIVLAGCASGMKGLREMLKDKCRIKIRFSAIRDKLVRGRDDMLGDPQYMQVVSLMLKGTEGCVSQPYVPKDFVAAEEEEEEETEKEKEVVTKPKTSYVGFFKRNKNKKEKKPAPVTKPEPSLEENTGDNKNDGIGGFFDDFFKDV
jgi:cell division protein FtsA